MLKNDWVGGDTLNRPKKPRPRYAAGPAVEVPAQAVGAFESIEATATANPTDDAGHGATLNYGSAPSPTTGFVPTSGTFNSSLEAPSVLQRGERTSGRAPYKWSALTVAELVRFRSEINQALPPLELGKMNLEEEMLLQYHSMRELQGKVMEDDDVPVNQRAQVANTMAATLKTIGDQQIALYSSERFKEIENLLIRTLDKLPEEVAAVFIEQYEKILSKQGK